MSSENNIDNNFYKLNALSIDGKEISMQNYKGKVVLVVNTASKCGFTPQYKELEELYKKYKSEGFEILGFPCNQFANQELGNEKDISQFCELNYGVTFQMFSKIDVNGISTHPIFKFLKSKLSGILGSRIKWNFTKFLIDKNGNPYRRFAPNTSPKKLENDILKLIRKK